jgi:hypothetical protein
MDGWSVALLVISGYVAVLGLVRLMLARRNKWLVDLEQQAAAAARRKRKADENDRAA